MMRLPRWLVAGFVAATCLIGASAPAAAEPARGFGLVWGLQADRPTVDGAGYWAEPQAQLGAGHLAGRPDRLAPEAVTAGVRQPWMSSAVGAAWKKGFRGQGTTIIVVDDFTSGKFLRGDLGLGSMSRRHGGWTRLEASMVAPSARVVGRSFNNPQRVPLAADRLNIVNLSYGMMARAGYAPHQIRWEPREQSLINHARAGRALIVKSAGNDGVALGTANRDGNADYLSLALIGADAAIFVGALDRNGAPNRKARLAGYSNRAGANPAIQRRFLAVGVRNDLTGLAGTSFAAPVVSGYAAVLGSKFTTASPMQIGNRLLDTARTDTIRNYRPSVHGRGEASLARALAPARID